MVAEPYIPDIVVVEDTDHWADGKISTELTSHVPNGHCEKMLIADLTEVWVELIPEKRLILRTKEEEQKSC